MAATVKAAAKGGSAMGDGDECRGEAAAAPMTEGDSSKGDLSSEDAGEGCNGTSAPSPSACGQQGGC